MGGICDGRVVIVTGAGRGIGREHALELARQGAKVVVNDLGVTNDGRGGDSSPATEVVDLIKQLGSDAFVSGVDVADFAQTKELVEQTLKTFGRLDAVVNNAGFVRDKMFVSCGEDEWDAIMRVHLKGHFCISRHAAAHWRDEAKAGRMPNARIVNTSSGAGVLGSVGQSAYSSAKAGIATLTLVQAAELARYGVTANAICPIARTRMTEAVFADAMKAPEDGFDANDPSNVSPFVAWLASSDSEGVTGRVWEVTGGRVTAFDGYRRDGEVDLGKRWNPADLGPAIRKVLAESKPLEKVYGT